MPAGQGSFMAAAQPIRIAAPSRLAITSNSWSFLEVNTTMWFYRPIQPGRMHKLLLLDPNARSCVAPQSCILGPAPGSSCQLNVMTYFTSAGLAFGLTSTGSGCHTHVQAGVALCSQCRAGWHWQEALGAWLDHRQGLASPDPALHGVVQAKA